MHSRRVKITLILIGIATIIGGAFFFSRASAETMWAKFRNSQVFYAEIPQRAPQPASAIATPVTNMKIPILVYHIVRPSYPTDSKGVRALAQTPEVFDAQMQYLADAGYHVISFTALEKYYLEDAPLPTRPIVISFDDGWSDQFKYAFPILQKHHYTATFFVFTNPIGRRGFLSWDNLQTLVAAGMTIGSHTLSHPFLNKVTDPNILWSEINASKNVLEKNLGITITEFAYPFGQYNASTTELVKRAGYSSARGDYVMQGAKQTVEQLYTLSALNAPTTLELFVRTFPMQ
jgi:peptidoglycan/xylan/chitin deacetylase (PgdA/CDA1 family)